MKNIKKFISDLVAINKVLGPLFLIKFILKTLSSFSTIIKYKSLQVVDLKMGSGPFNIKYNQNVSFWIQGNGIFSGIREMFLRDVYFKKGLLKIKDNDIVVDLGANIGNFSNLALAHGPNVKVFAVEPSKTLNKHFIQSLSLNNGFLNRFTLISAFFGSKIESILNKVKGDPDYTNIEFISEIELLNKIGVHKIDFLKCDIEGGEFFLIEKESILLDITKSIAIEVHAFAGDVYNFINEIELRNFKIIDLDFYKDGSCIILAQKEE